MKTRALAPGLVAWLIVLAVFALGYWIGHGSRTPVEPEPMAPVRVVEVATAWCITLTPDAVASLDARVEALEAQAATATPTVTPSPTAMDTPTTTPTPDRAATVSARETAIAARETRISERETIIAGWTPTPSATVTPSLAVTEPPTIPPPPTATPVSDGIPTVVPIIYRFFDSGGDWQKLHPEWGPIGAIHYVSWEAMNPEPGVYNWAVIDNELAKERGLRVTMPDGTEIPKPVVLQVFPYFSSTTYPGWGGIYFYDATPRWVYDRIDAGNPGKPRPVVNGHKVGYALAGCSKTAVIPMYDSPVWQDAYFAMVRAFGARYNGDGQVTAVTINTGLDGETQLTKDWYCNWEELVDLNIGGLRYRFGQYVYKCMDVYRAAFPNKPIFINNATGGNSRKSTSDYAATAKPPIGLKNSGLWVDRDSHQGYGNFVGMWDMYEVYSQTLPIWLESAYGFGNPEQDYWTILAGLHYHPSAIDLHSDMLPLLTPEVLRWAGEHLGVTITTTPSVWTVLRDAEYPLQSWGDGGVSGKIGDWTFWLYRVERPDGGTVRVLKEQLPVAAQGQIYSRQARRTDQANGDQYVYFDVDDRFKGAGLLGQTFSIRVVLLNQGTDTLALEYRNSALDLETLTLRKGAALGPVDQWISYTFTVKDAYLANNLSGADFRLSCEADGDEFIHLVEVMAE